MPESLGGNTYIRIDTEIEAFGVYAYMRLFSLVLVSLHTGIPFCPTRTPAVTCLIQR
jgi:hypothetical protein